MRKKRGTRKVIRMFQSLVVLLVFLSGLCLDGLAANPPLPAFPGAEGFGAFTPGGRGGKVYKVTTLRDGGSGSLRAAVEAYGPRIVVFEVSGNIKLYAPLTIKNPYITIAGQTAPGDGICIYGYPVSIETHDVIVRHLRIRLGDINKTESDALSINNARNVIVDHLSTSWSVDETLSVTESKDVTVQWSIISESLNRSAHSKGQHGYGSLVRGSYGAKYSFHHNLWAHHRNRMPRPGNYNNHKIDPIGLLADFRNNIFYNWDGSRGGYNDDKQSVSKYNFINNYYKQGPNSSGKEAFREGCPYAQAYFAGNYMNGMEPEDPWKLVRLQFSLDYDSETHGSMMDVMEMYKQNAPFEVAEVKTETAPEAYEHVMAKAGAFPRDEVDARIIADVLNGTGQLIDSQNQVGGWPGLKAVSAPVDTDGDGIPDWWEKEHGLDPKNPADAAQDRDGDGYTNIEEYLNELAELVITK